MGKRMLYVWDEDRGGRGTFAVCVCTSFKHKCLLTQAHQIHTQVCMKACKMWDLHGLHVLLLDSRHLWLLLSKPARCCNWTQVTQINIVGQ